MRDLYNLWPLIYNTFGLKAVHYDHYLGGIHI